MLLANSLGQTVWPSLTGHNVHYGQIINDQYCKNKYGHIYDHKCGLEDKEKCCILASI